MRGAPDNLTFPDVKYWCTDVNPIRETARLPIISGYTTSPLNGTRPIHGKKMATPGSRTSPAEYYRPVPPAASEKN
jgi:hypothetical protein